MKFLIALLVLFHIRHSYGVNVVYSNNRPNKDLSSNIESSEHLYSNTWAVHLEGGERKAREIAEKNGFNFVRKFSSFEDYYLFEHKDVENRRNRRSIEHHSRLEREPTVRWAEQQKILKRTKRGFQDFTDPLFAEQWYLKNRGITSCKETKGINVVPVWEKGITGKGVVVTILDDGLEHSHADLVGNYEPGASYDFNSGDPDPFPTYTSDNINKHGTRCAGEVAGAINNGLCGVGVAYNSRVGGVRMLDGDVTDAVEGQSLSLNPQKIDIYSSSWGPDDDGKTVDGPGHLAYEAFTKGTTKGRDGKGSIFVWATGNGGKNHDYCSCDGYINSIYTVSIGAVDDCGKSPWYAEPCPGTMAVTYSSGVSGINKEIVTTDLHNKCTMKHTGTSAAAPLAAGIFALVLEANPELTWRDLQHLVVKTSKKISENDNMWQKNDAGLSVNPKFGFGVLDTAAMVEAAKSSHWKTADEQHICKSKVKKETKDIPAMGSVTSEIFTSGCFGQPSSVNQLEHVHAYITLKHPSRGGLSISLKSPSGITSPLLEKRILDTASVGFTDWPFLTVFNWGENPTGTWELTVKDSSGRGGVLVEWRLDVYGTFNSSLVKHVDENKMCIDECVKGCPHPFSEKCIGCKKYCDCEKGVCVSQCDSNLSADHERRHCRRALNTEIESNSDASAKNGRAATSSATVKVQHSLLSISMPAKFAVIALSAAVLLALAGAIGYFLMGLPNTRNSGRAVDYQMVGAPGKYVVDLNISHEDPTHDVQ